MTIFDLMEYAQGHLNGNNIKKLNGNTEWVENTEVDVNDFIKEIIKDENIEVEDLFSQKDINYAATERIA